MNDLDKDQAGSIRSRLLEMAKQLETTVYWALPPDVVGISSHQAARAYTRHAANLMREAAEALAQQPTVDILSAPCRWCGYNGEGYWQTGTHAPICRWRHIGGEAERRRALMGAEALALPSPRMIEQQKDDVTRTGEFAADPTPQHASTNRKASDR